jgi:AcrR family transcriptional regulator
MDDAADGRTRRAQEAREARRAQILAGATAVFAARGYHGTSVSDLVEAAGIARGTFYLYFESKEQIFLALLDGLLVHLRASVRGVTRAPDAPPVLDQLESIAVRILQTLVDNRALTRIIFREAVALDRAVDERLGAFYGDLQQWVANSIALGQALGLIRPADPALSAACVLGCFRGVVQSQVVEADGPVDVRGTARAVLELMLRGLGA